MKEAINSGVYGWSKDGSFYSEAGYYDYIVVEGLTLNHPLALAEKRTRKWFTIKFDPKTGKTPIIPCREPTYWKRIIGFHSAVYPGYDEPHRFGAIDMLLKAIGFEEKAGNYSFSHRNKFDIMPKLLREMGFERMAKTVEKRLNQPRKWPSKK